MPTLRVDPDVELHYYDDDFTDPWKPAPSILLQHGFSRSGKFWYNWVPLLARDFRVLRPDMRGMGLSRMAAEQYQPSLDTFVEDACRILDHLGIERVVWVGESFGGIIGLKFAHRHPERTEALALVNTPCRLPRRDRTTPGGDWGATLAKGVGAWSTATINMRLDTRYAPEGMKEWYIAEMDKTNSDIGRKLQSYLDTLDFGPYLREIAVPTLLLVGNESPTATIEQQRFIASQIPHCQLEVYPGVGHGINALYPGWCVQGVRDFLSRVGVG